MFSTRPLYSSNYYYVQSMGTYQGRQVPKAEEEHVTVIPPGGSAKDPSAPIFGSPIDSQ